MKETGIVKSVDGEFCTCMTKRKSACGENCASCKAACSSREHTFVAKNKIGAEVGDTVVKGQKIGTISDSAYDEFKEGPHVHLCVYENGVKIDPEKYLRTQEK